MEDLAANILKYGAQKDLSKLTELVRKSDIEQLENLINKSLHSPSFSRIWDYLLKAFQDTPQCHQNRIKIILSVLNELEARESLSSHVQTNLIQRLCMDLNKLETEHLVEICNFCLKSIQSNKVCLAISWKDLLPDTLRILSEKDLVNFNELEYSGQEFKTTFITTLCMSNWSPAKITQLAAMFCDMSLNKEEHLKVVNKLACYIEKLTPQEVPPFVYQLLRLCRHQNSRSVFLRLQHYFGLRIYHNANFTRSNSEASTPDFDIIENAEDHDALDAEGMVLYHIQNAASIGHNCIRDYLSSMKNTVKSPDFVLHPFQLLALFTVSTVAQYEETVFDIVRHAIVRSYNEQQKKASSYWYRDIVTTSVRPEDVFNQIMSIGDREFLLEALVHFGFALLNVGSALGRDPIAEKQWTLGTMILLKIIKRKRNVAGEVLKTFCNHILTKQSATQYIECLYFLSRSSPLLMLENQSCVAELMDSLMQIPGNVAKQLLDALMPLTKVSPSIRDQLILILRKCLYSRSIETRRVAVFGYVKLISILQLSTGGFLSQNSCGSFSSGYSLYTQISLNRTTQSASASTFSNEAICWEVLGILKRCFMQQIEVKLELYEELYAAVCVNSELGPPVLDVLWCHFMDYYVIDEDSSPPLNLGRATLLKDADCVLQEPVGKLVFVVSQIVAKLARAEDDADSATVQKYTGVLDSLCRRMANCELVHFELDDGTDLTDPLPESQQKTHILKEVISVFEALIGYKIATLSAGNDDQCGIINSLFQGYSRFLHFGKNLAKPKKAAKKPDKSTQKGDKTTQKSTIKETQAKKIDNGMKRPSPKNFNAPDTLLDLATVEKALKTLLEPTVPWVATDDANKIRTKTDLHRHMVHAAMFLIGKIKNSKVVDTACQKSHFDHVTSIAEALYDRIIKRANDYIDFDCAAAILGLECFHSAILLVNGQYKNNVINFLSKVGGKDKNESIIEHLKPIIDTFEKLFEADEDELSNDPEIKKLPVAVANNLSALCTLIPSGSNVLSVEVYDWLKQIAYNNTVSNRVAGAFANLLCETHLRFKSGLALFEHISSTFLTIYGTHRDDESVIEETGDENPKIVNVNTANIVLQSLCSYIRTVLEDVESVIARIKSDYSIVTYPGEDDTKRKEELKTKEKGVTCQLCFLAKILTNLTTLLLPPGNLADTIFKNIVHFYSSLSSLTKYVLGRSAKNQALQAGWFEKLVKLTGKRLAPEIYMFVYCLESGQNREDEQTPAGRKKAEGAAMKSKILRETKTIPKVVYEMEQFSKYIIQLSKKTRCDLSKYVGQGTSRDFKINLQNVQGELQRAQASNASQEDEEQAEAGPDIVESDNEVASRSGENDGSVSPPPPKKAKR